MRQNRFNISTGVIEVNYPDKMTADDVHDFKDQMAITFRILERNVEQPMSGLFSTLNPGQKKQALEYTGDENLGEPLS
jgi:hypothetical protein